MTLAWWLKGWRGCLPDGRETGMRMSRGRLLLRIFRKLGFGAEGWGCIVARGMRLRILVRRRGCVIDLEHGSL